MSMVAPIKKLFSPSAPRPLPREDGKVEKVAKQILCGQCHQVAKKPITCAKCETIRYCSVPCLNKDYPRHIDECFIWIGQHVDLLPLLRKSLEGKHFLNSDFRFKYRGDPTLHLFRTIYNPKKWTICLSDQATENLRILAWGSPLPENLFECFDHWYPDILIVGGALPQDQGFSEEDTFYSLTATVGIPRRDSDGH
jgi:hypothetical protein